MSEEPLYRMPKDIPHAAQAKEQRLRQIREQATIADKLEAYRLLLKRAA